MEVPIRTCLVCRERRPKPALVRLVDDHGTVIADDAARRPGRGAYVCATEVCVDELLRRGRAPVARALRCRAAAVRVDGEGLRSALARRADDDREATAVAREGRVPPAARGAWT